MSMLLQLPCHAGFTGFCGVFCRILLSGLQQGRYGALHEHAAGLAEDVCVGPAQQFALQRRALLRFEQVEKARL